MRSPEVRLSFLAPLWRVQDWRTELHQQINFEYFRTKGRRNILISKFKFTRNMILAHHAWIVFLNTNLGKIFLLYSEHFGAGECKRFLKSWLPCISLVKFVKRRIFVQHRERVRLLPEFTIYVRKMWHWTRKSKNKSGETAYLWSVLQTRRNNWTRYSKTPRISTMNANPRTKRLRDFLSSLTRRKGNCQRPWRRNEAKFQRLKVMLSWWRLCERRKTGLLRTSRGSVMTSQTQTLTLIIWRLNSSTNLEKWFNFPFGNWKRKLIKLS